MHASFDIFFAWLANLKIDPNFLGVPSQTENETTEVTTPPSTTKGQLISKYIFGVSNSPEKQTKTIRLELQ